MASTNPDSMTPAQGEFQPSRPKDEPLTTKGHQPGQLVGNDRIPESHVQTLPAGTAPPESTFKPNPIGEVPGQADNDATLRAHGKESTYTSAADTLGGATSGDVHQGLGHPGQGQTSSELRHEGAHTSSKQGGGLEGVGATGGSGMVDERVTASQRGLERDEAASGQRGDKGAEAAEDKLPESAEAIASGRV